MQIYNPTKYKWERDPNGKYAYGATCVRECPEHLLKDNGACVRACPEKKKVTNNNNISVEIINISLRALSVIWSGQACCLLPSLIN